MKEVKARLTGETPSFFKKVQKIGGIVAFTGFLIANATIALPAIIVAAGSYMAWVGGTAVAVAQFALKDTSVLPQKIEDNTPQ